MQQAFSVGFEINRMSKETNEKKVEKLLGRLVELISQLNILEKTFSRLKSETDELLRIILKRNGKNTR